MLKFVFWLLFAANIIVFASNVDYSGTSKTQTDTGNPDPIEQDRIRILSSSRHVLPVSSIEEKKKEALGEGCIELENFNPDNAELFEKKMALPANQINRTVSITGSSYMVYIPPFKNTKAAEKRISELKAKGITNYFLITESTQFRHAISLGIFKTEKSAKNLQEELKRRGIHDATITARGKTNESISFRLNNLNSSQTDHLNAVLVHFPEAARKACEMRTETVQ